MDMEYYDDFPVYSTIKELILGGAQRGGDKKQFMYEDSKHNVYEKTFKDVYEDECALGSLMYSRGMKHGMKIAILSENSYDWNVIYYMTLAGGFVSVPLDSRLSAIEIVEQLSDCGCDALFFSSDNKEKAEAVKSSGKFLNTRFFCTENISELYEAGRKAEEKYLDEYLSAKVEPEDMACIVYTSGTTGKTKGVMLSNKNIMSDVNASLHAITGSHGIGFLPLNHTYAWVSGLFASLVRCEWGYICTNIASVYKDIKKYKPHQFAAVPLVVEMIYHNIISNAKRNGKYESLMRGIETSNNFLLSGYDARREIFSEIHENLGGNLEYILCGGAYLNPEIEQFMQDIGIPVLTGYGLTECSPCVTLTRRFDYKPGSMGRPLECSEVKIHEPNEDGIGEIYVKGDNVMMGYYNDPKATAEVFDGEWLKTGDYGYIDEDGYVFFTGRKKNLIILSNGKNAAPEEIENKLYSIEYVKEVLVYEEKGRICGEFFLDTEKYPDAEKTLKADVAKVNKLLADYKQVNHIKIRDTEFPKTTTLKIIRNKHN